MADDFEELFGDLTDQPAANGPQPGSLPPMPPKSRKEMRRRRDRGRRHVIVAIVAVLVVLSLVVGAGAFGYVQLKHWISARESDSSDTADYPGPGSGSVSFTVQSGQGVAQIASNLVRAGIVKSSGIFATAVSSNNSTLYPGTYALKYRMSSADVVKILSDQSKAKGLLQVRSGERVSDVLGQAAKLSGIPASEFTAVIDAGGTTILPAEANGKYEGWFGPGSYDVKAMKSATAIIKAIVDQRIEDLDTLGAPQGAQRERILIIASIAESEVNSDAYYGKVSRVILNRLGKNMPLGMDTTVAYGLGIQASALTDAMLSDGSNPYNTRVNKGLPPTPISNPGDEALRAAMNPPAGDWLYFVTTDMKTGETKFATTEDEFWKLREEYKSSNSNAN